MLKLEPLTDHELEFIRWRLWEPLRRNQYYINEFAKLKDGYFLSLDKVNAFCVKWNIPYTIDPEIEFDSLLKPKGDETDRQAKQRVRGVFYDLYEPLFDHAAFVDLRHWIVDGKYLRLWVNLEASRNSIEAALKKELDEWRSMWKEFYGKNIKREIPTNAIETLGLTGKYLELHINLEAPRSTRKNVVNGYIEPEINLILNEWLSKWKGEKTQSPRLSKTWDLCFKIYDLIEQQGFTQDSIAKSLQTNPSTVQKRYKKAHQSIYPSVPYPTKTYRKKEIALEVVKDLCESCQDKTCLKTKKPCKKITRYIDQDHVLPINYIPLYMVAKKVAVDIHGNRVEPVEHGKRGHPTADEQFENMTSPPEPRMLNEIKDCEFCPGVFCVHRSIRFKDYFCTRCGALQSTGKNPKELLLFT